MRKRHKILWFFIRIFVICFTFIKFGYRFKVPKNLPENYIVLSNHTTDFDPLFVAASFKKDMRYVASEHIARWKHAYKFIKFAFDPILINKGTTAASTVKEMLRTVRNGTNLCMFAEGSRTWNGITSPVSTSTAKVVKSAKCALITFKISGGYFVSPLWSEGGTRRGRISGQVINIYTAEQIALMTTDEIKILINNDLYEDAYETISQSRTEYKSKNSAVRLESMMFYCPECNAIDSLYSHNSTVTCKKCGHHFTIGNCGEIEGISLKSTKEIFTWLIDKVNDDVSKNTEYTISNANVITINHHSESIIHTGKVNINNSRLRFGSTVIEISDIEDMNMHGKYAVLLSTKNDYFEIKVNSGTCALKLYLYYLALNNKLKSRFTF